MNNPEKVQSEKRPKEKSSYLSHWTSLSNARNTQSNFNRATQPGLFISSIKTSSASASGHSTGHGKGQGQSHSQQTKGRSSIFHGYSTRENKTTSQKYTSSSVESDFSDHFKIRSQNDPVQNVKKPEDVTIDIDVDVDVSGDQNPLKLKSSCDNLVSNDDVKSVNSQQELETKSESNSNISVDLNTKPVVEKTSSTKKFLTPFQFGKGQSGSGKSSGISSLIDYIQTSKGSLKQKGGSSSSTASSYGSRISRLFSTSNTRAPPSQQSSSTIVKAPIPGRARVVQQQPQRISVLRPFTATPTPTPTLDSSVQNNNNNLRRKSNLLENNDISAISLPEDSEEKCWNETQYSENLEASKKMGDETNADSGSETDGENSQLKSSSRSSKVEEKPPSRNLDQNPSPTSTSQVKSRIGKIESQIPVPVSSPGLKRHPFGYFLKQGKIDSNSSVRNLGPGVGQNQSLNSQQKANVYKNQGYTPSAFIPLVPTPLGNSSSSTLTSVSTSSKNNGSSTTSTVAPSVVQSYTQQYYARLLAVQNPSFNNLMPNLNLNPNPNPAAKGDAPANSEIMLKAQNLEKLAHGNESTESGPKIDLENIQEQGSNILDRIRPQTVCEGQVSSVEKLQMSSTVKPAPASTSIGLFPQKSQQGGLAQKSSFFTPFPIPNRLPAKNKDNLSPRMSGIGTGTRTTAAAMAGSTIMMTAKYSRNDLTSPLGNFHMPIRPFIITSSHDNNNGNTTPNFDLGSLNLNEIAWGNVTTCHHSIFQTCSQKFPIPIHLVFEPLVNIKKVGEGVYGEVFSGYFRGLPDQRVYKVVPIEGSKIVNGEKQKKFGEVEPEIIISQELNKLRQGQNGCYTDGISKLLFTRVCQGKYPQFLVEQWKTWHRAYVSQNDVPEFDANQLYIIFEFEYHGTDIESYFFKNARQSMAVLLHVIHALAVAEAGCEFEHRDLHWGNILVQKTREPFTTYKVLGNTFRVPNCGLKSTIIDFTISRLTSSSGQPIFTDLANDEDQFCGSEDYQFDIYRMMRDENKNNWASYCPKTNIFWAHYLVEKLIEKGRYVDTTSPTHNLFRNKLFKIQSSLLKFSSCQDCVKRFLPPYCRDLELDGCREVFPS